VNKLSEHCEFVFGGSFDPIHFGHLNIIKSIKAQFPANLIRIMPCAIPALKDNTAASFEQRVDMLKLAIAELPKSSKLNIVVDKKENQREGFSFTLDSLIELSHELPNQNWLLVIGADSLNNMTQWHQWQQLAKHCHLVIVKRPGSKINEFERLLQQLGFSCAKNSQELAINAFGRYYCLNCEEKDISSTRIRSHLKRGLSVDKLLPLNVIDYIKKESLYSCDFKS
jgi:nicotinate-nucleotide adenylyltransferase